MVFNDWCSVSKNPVVLIIDEVDSAANNQVFLDFLAQLRDGYISRDTIKLLLAENNTLFQSLTKKSEQPAGTERGNPQHPDGRDAADMERPAGCDHPDADVRTDQE